MSRQNSSRADRLHHDALGTIVPLEVQRSSAPVATQAIIVSLPNRTVRDIGALQRADAVFGEPLGFWERQILPNSEALKACLSVASAGFETTIVFSVLMEGRKFCRYYFHRPCVMKF